MRSAKLPELAEKEMTGIANEFDKALSLIIQRGKEVLGLGPYLPTNPFNNRKEVVASLQADLLDLRWRMRVHLHNIRCHIEMALEEDCVNKQIGEKRLIELREQIRLVCRRHEMQIDRRVDEWRSRFRKGGD